MMQKHECVIQNFNFTLTDDHPRELNINLFKPAKGKFTHSCSLFGKILMGMQSVCKQIQGLEYEY